MMTRLSPLCAFLIVPSLIAAELREATFTQVIKDVTVVSAGTKSSAKAKLNEKFINPDIVQTGPDSLAELIAADKTVTRIGANTIFSFSGKGREINLEQGSVLFHSPKGKGGGTIKTKAASASVLGTTIVVTATVGGGFKAIVLEGRGQITLPNGSFRILQAGQVTFVLPGSQRFGPQLNINLSKLVENSRLVQGFEQELPSKPVIQAAIERQNILIRAGLAEDTGLLVANQATEETVATVIIEKAVEVRRDEIALARADDVTIRTSDLGIFSSTSPKHLFLDRTAVDLPVLGVLNFSGLIGKNITITASSLDFSPFAGMTDFTIAADNALKIEKPPIVAAVATPDLDLTATTPSLQSVSFVARNSLTIETGYLIRATRIGDVSFVSGASMLLDRVTFENAGGKVELNGKTGLELDDGGINSQSLLVNGGTVDVKGGTFSAQKSAVFSGYGSTLKTANVTISGETVSLEAHTSSDLHDTTASATTSINLDSRQDVNVAGGSYSVSGPGGELRVTAGRDILVDSSAQFQANTVNLTATAGNATLTSPAIRGFTMLNVTAAGDLAVTSGSFTGASGAATASLQAGGASELMLSDTSISSVASISLSAKTVNLAFVDFPMGTTVSLYSQFGALAPNPNTGQSSIPGFVNYINGVKYAGVTLTDVPHPSIHIGVRAP